MDYSITVITLTRRRPNLLKRAIASVQQQDYQGTIVHMIMIDGCVETRELLQSSNLPEEVTWHWMPRKPEDASGPKRIAELRNRAVQLVKTEWISFLDDDNEFEPQHISSLIVCAKYNGCEAAHSQRKLFWLDGTPYLEPRLPWCRDEKKNAQLYLDLCKEGILEPGSNIVRDRAIPRSHPEVGTSVVDTGDWLLKRTVLLKYPFSTEYTYDDWLNLTTEDDKLLKCLIENGIPIACTELPTLRYYLGGYSNTFNHEENSWLPDK